MSYDLKKHEFPIGIVALIFFDQRPAWLRYHDERFVDNDGNALGNRKENRRGGDRYYTLDDIQKVAAVLRRYGIIDAIGYDNCLNRIATLKQPVFKRRKRRNES